MKTSEMTIGDVIMLPEFRKEIENVVKELRESRAFAKAQAFKRGEMLKAHPVETLMTQGEWNADFLIQEYNEVLNKTSTQPRTIRDFVNVIGNETFKKVMQKLIDDEKVADKRDGQD